MPAAGNKIMCRFLFVFPADKKAYDEYDDEIGQYYR
jgi:hypothetical protein